MFQFKPSEIRIILFLTALALAGSVLVLIQRQEKALRFSLSFLGPSDGYKYRYDASDLKLSDISGGKAESAFSHLADSLDNVELVDINNCGYYEFEALPGIGPALAERIIEYRDSVGEFHEIDELLNVRGIGPFKFERIKDRVSVR
jgi:comEA protein